MKIGHLLSNYFPKVGGAQICVHNIAARCAEKGHEALVMTTSPASRTDVHFKYRIVRINPLLNRLFECNFNLGKAYLQKIIYRMQKEHNFDVWQVTFGYPLGAASVDFFNRNGIPCILRCTGEDLQTAPAVEYGYRLRRNVDRLVRVKYRNFTALVALSDSVQKDYLSLGISPQKIAIIPNGVDCHRFDIRVDREKIKDGLGIDKSHKLILTVGRNHPKKGFTYIPQIIKRLVKERTDFRWLLVGKDNSKIKSLADKEGVGAYIITREISPAVSDSGKFEAPSDILIQYYKVSDIFAFPTLIETFGMVLVEAMAAGLPIVTTNALGVNDIIRDNENGLKCRTGNIECLTESILKLLSSKEIARKLGESALKDAKNYDWSKVVDKYLELYKNTIDCKWKR